MKGEDPSHLLLRLFSLPAEYRPSQDRRPRTLTAYHSRSEGMTCIFQTAWQPQRKSFRKVSSGTQICKRCHASSEDQKTYHLLKKSSRRASLLPTFGIQTTPVSSGPPTQACAAVRHGCISVLPSLQTLTPLQSLGTLHTGLSNQHPGTSFRLFQAKCRWYETRPF